MILVMFLYPYVLGVEELLGIEVPERAKYVRVIASELNRCIYIQCIGLQFTESS